MSEQIPDDMQFMISVPEAVHFTGDGLASIEVSTYGNIKSEDERRELIATTHSISPDGIKRVDESTAAGRLAVGFRKWRSDWDPHAQRIDPNLN